MADAAASRGRLAIICGPSGVGKQTILAGLADRWPFRFAVSATTRPPRPGEADGEHYFFLDEAEFAAWAEQGRLLEWERYAGHCYGTPVAEVEGHLTRGRNVVLDVEAKGARRIMDEYPQATAVFLQPPSMEELENRLRGRGDMTEEAIAARMEVAAEQMRIGESFPHHVVNHRAGDAVREIAAILEGAPREPRLTRRFGEAGGGTQQAKAGR